jgi:hypothetical protein
MNEHVSSFNIAYNRDPMCGEVYKWIALALFIILDFWLRWPMYEALHGIKA